MAIILVIFRAERDFCIISDCSNSFNNKLKNLSTSKNFFNRANTQSSSEESLKDLVKRLLECVPFHLVQYANTEFMSQMT